MAGSEQAAVLVPSQIILFQALTKALRGRVTMRKLIRTASKVLGVPVHVRRDGDGAWGRITGFALEWQSGWKIWVRGTDSRLYQDHVILHELTHLLCNHAPCGVYRRSTDPEGGVIYARPASFDHLSSVERAEEYEAEAGAYAMARLMVTPASEREEAVL